MTQRRPADPEEPSGSSPSPDQEILQNSSDRTPVMLTAYSRSSASPEAAYRSLHKCSIFEKISIVSTVPNRQLVFLKAQSGPITEYLGKLDFLPEIVGGTIICARADFTPVSPWTTWPSRWVIGRAMSRLVRQLSDLAPGHDHDAPPYY